MSENHQRPTIASDIAMPVEIVELLSLKTTAGEPVRVLCERIDRLEASQILGQLPGAFEVLETTAAAKGDTFETVRRFRPLGSVLIERAAVLLNPDGSELRPAFWHTTPVPGAFPCRLLSSEDFTLLSNTILRLSGYLGGAAADGGFSAEKPEGDADGKRALESGAGDGDDAAGGSVPPGSCVLGVGAEGSRGVEGPPVRDEAESAA